MDMPLINLESLSEILSSEDYQIATQIVVTRGKNKGRLRASKPPGGSAAYVWRMVAFYVSPLERHHGVPISADIGLPVEHLYGPEYNDLRSQLDNIVDAVVDTIPAGDRYGLMRWGEVLGLC